MPIFLLNEKVVALKFITRKEFEQPDQQAVQDAVIEAVPAAPERFLRACLADDRCHGGRYVSADLFKEVFAQFGASKDSRNRYDTPVHNPAAVLSSEQFRRAVADGSEPKRDQVVFLTGVPGAGKTTSVSKNRKFPKDCRAIFDGQIPRPASIVTKMQQALDAGSTPRIVAIHARPEKALESTRQRFDEYGRGAGIEVMAEMLAGLPDDLLAVQKHFGDKVKLHIADHRNRARPKVLTGWENLDLLRSEGNHERVRQRLDDALEKHRPHLSEPAYRQAKGLQPLDRQHDRPMDTGPGGYLQAPEQRRSLSQGSGQAPVLAPTRSPQERESQT
ncbi:hypothetical protein [Verminephrobacter eiseniae]|uniref:hypothetical protein n=1 Tax=Verminephrobacter eiseniae TaxID=364317 RepID=UPI0018DD96F5|nr:hypothetical protein [Verminephrobacter eiseniae]